jgi:diaminopimelate decarboxylase
VTGISGTVCYAVKACGFAGIIRIAAQAGAGADVASEYELESALKAGIAPQKLVCHGNAKSDLFLERAVALKALIAANHHTELDRIEAVAARQRKRVPVLLRLSGFDLNPVTASGIFTAGTWCKFGEPLREVPSLLKYLAKWPHIELAGFHVHIGSQIADLKPYQMVFGKIAELAGIYQEILGRPVQILNLGGGFPVSYVDKRTWESLQKTIRRQSQVFHPHPNLPPSRGIRGEKDSLTFWAPVRHVTWEGISGGYRADPGTGKIDWTNWAGEKFYCQDEKEKIVRRLLGGRIPFEGREVPANRVLKKIGSPQLMVEPGRAIVGDAGLTLARVMEVYEVAGGHPLVTLDLGLVNHGTGLIEPDLYSWTLVNVGERKRRRPFRAFVAGRLCFSGDMISRYLVSFPRKPVRGDLAVIEKTGAYASTFFASRANGFPLPNHVLIKGKQTLLLSS